MSFSSFLRVASLLVAVAVACFPFEVLSSPFGSRSSVAADRNSRFDPTQQEHCLPPLPNPQAERPIVASARRDIYMSSDKYPEPAADPVDGVRWQIAALPQTGGQVTDVRINGASLDTLMRDGVIDWYHVWPRNLEPAKPIFVMFHTRKKEISLCKSHSITVSTQNGDVVSGEFMGNQSPVRLSSVVVRENLSEMVVHLQNRSVLNKQEIVRVRVNGQDVTNTGVVGNRVMRPGQTFVWVFPLPEPVRIGDAWTVSVEFANIDDEVGVGRVVPSFFPIETWPASAECPYPDGNLENFNAHLKNGFDTYFLGTFSNKPGCPGKTHADMLRGFAGTSNWLVVNQHVEKGLSRSQNVAARLIGDEADNTSEGELSAKMREKVKLSWEHWESSPDVPTYIGASRNKRVGMFAGIADIQGMDYYAAACAPHITTWGKGYFLRGPLDYLNTTRLNHMPNPTWLYAQGLSRTWNGKSPLLNTMVHRQPRSHEILIQAMSAIAAGAKGLMWFQSELAEANANKPQRGSWEAMGRFNRDVAAVRNLLIESAPTGKITSIEDKVHAEALLSPRAIVVPVINFNDVGAPTDFGCAMQKDMHWEIAEATTRLTIPIPRWLKVTSVFEVRNGVLTPAANRMQIEPGEVVIHDVNLDMATPVRLYVLGGADLVEFESR